MVCAYSERGGARRRPHRAPSLTKSTSDCDVLLRSSHTKRSGIMREMSLSMRVPSVAPCGAVPWVPSSTAQRGNGIGETPEEGGKLYLEELRHDTFYYSKTQLSAVFECITRKSRPRGNPNLLIVNELTYGRLCRSYSLNSAS